MKILVVSGFLGAGKTTFITHMAKRCHEKFVVMENEMGAVGVDGGLLSSALQDDVKVWELTEGCICCSMKTDFATSVLTIENALSPEYLLVEPTGVGILSKIISNIQSIAYERISLLSPITVLDACACYDTARDFPDLFADQLGAAGTVIVSKTEAMDSDSRDQVHDFVRQYAPQAEIIARPYAEQSDEWWSNLWRRQLSGAVVASNDTSEIDLENVGLTQVPPLSPGQLVTLLEKTVRGHFGNVVRAKGMIPASNGQEMLRFDVVDGRYSIIGADACVDAKAVFIGRNLKNKHLLSEEIIAFNRSKIEK